MELVSQMLTAHPLPPPASRSALGDCLEANAVCQITCSSCADACLAETSLAELRRCIRLNLDCADLCGATLRFISRFCELDLEIFRAQLEVCARTCATCAAECLKHADRHEHCRVCADACRRCEQACLALANELLQEREAAA